MNAFETEDAKTTGNGAPMAVIAVEERVVYRYHIPLTESPAEAEAVALERFRDGELADAGPTEGEQHDLSARYVGLLTGRELSYEDWQSLYRPQPNDMVAHAPFDGAMFETCGDEFAHVVAAPERTVWTLIAEGEDMAVVNGLRFADRIGYFVTEVPWPEGLRIEVEID